MKMTRVLPAQDERVETGVTRFGDDWPGLFVRGDDCAAYALYLSNVLDGHGSTVDLAMLKVLLVHLRQTNVNETSL